MSKRNYTHIRERKPAKTLQEYKYQVIYCHRMEYPVSVMCQFFGVSRSGYYTYISRIGYVNKDAVLAERIKEHQDRCHQTYGYRRMHL